MTDAQLNALRDLAWAPETSGIWWHDLPAGAREVLRRRRWIREVRRVKCSTHRRRHPGYVTISKIGVRALAKEDERRKLSVRYGNPE
jgi:hypothetical protein